MGRVIGRAIPERLPSRRAKKESLERLSFDFLIFPAGSHSGEEGIAESDGEAGWIHVVELGIVVHDVVMRLGPDKHSVPNVVPEISTDVKHKMVDALIVGAGKAAAVEVRSVEAQALGSDASHDIGANLFVPGAANIGVEIIE